MSILYIDAFSGLSGDKFVGALLSLGAPFEELKKALSTLNINNYYEIEAINKNVMGINSVKFNVILKKNDKKHRGLNEIKDIISNSGITNKAKKTSLGIFNIIAKAESKIHNVDINEIEFHEVGAIDSIVDIVSTAVLLDLLKIEKVYSSHVPVGKGFINNSHGKLPVPAPATLEILKDIPIYGINMNTEITTPTGAAIINYIADEFINIPKITLNKIGYGAGNKELEIPNVLRILYSEENIGLSGSDIVTELQTNIDNSTPEQLGFLLDGLLGKGALDVYVTPILMKKNRQAQLLTVICNEEKRAEIEKFIFYNSSTFGIRRMSYLRTILKRNIKEFDVDDIKIKIKLGFFEDKLIQTTIEYDSIVNFSKIKKLSYNEAYNKIYKKISDINFEKIKKN